MIRGCLRAWTAGHGEHVCVAEGACVYRDFFVWAGVGYDDVWEGAFEEAGDRLGTVWAGVFATVDHGADGLGVEVFGGSHDGGRVMFSSLCSWFGWKWVGLWNIALSNLEGCL
jgi:hypothetical protein